MNLRLWSLLYRSWWLGTPRSPPYKHVVQIGDPVLRQTASPVDPAQIRSLAMLKLYQNLYYLMKLTKSAGLAAPQIGVSLRLFAVQAPDQGIPLQIWVNPEMRVLDYKKLVGEECCQSMQGFAAHVPRHTSVLLTGLNEEGKEKKLEASGWAARLLQHEMDHLDGKFFTDSMVPRSLAMTNWDAVNHHQGRIYVTYTPKR